MAKGEKRCKYCNTVLPADKHGSALYCDEDCYYEAKKIRSNCRYHELQSNYSIKKNNETILALLCPMSKNMVATTREILDSLGFIWGICDGEVDGSDKSIWKKIGLYHYVLNNDKTISIWKA